MKKEKLAAVVLMGVLTAGALAGCKSDTSSSDEAESKAEAEVTYEYHYNVADTEAAEKVPYNFGGEFGTNMRALDVSLDLDGEGNFTMDVHGYMVEDTEGSSTPVGEEFEFGNAMFAEFTSAGSGTYEENGDTVTVEFSEAAFEIPDLGASYLSQLFSSSNAKGGSYAPEGESYYGEWTSVEVPELLDQFPTTDFKLDGEEIITWERAGKLTAAEGEHASIQFYDDGTAYYEDTEGNVNQNMTWTAESGSVVLTYEDAVNGEITVTAKTGEEAEITVNVYSSATDGTAVTAKVQITEENITALQ